MRVLQADLQRLGAQRAASAPGRAQLGTSWLPARVSPRPAAAADSRVLDALRSAELRRLVRLVDSAPDGEAVRGAPRRAIARVLCSLTRRARQAIEAAMTNPRFAAFADRVLAVLRGESA